jgi:ADP-ribose pyrophosphatase
MDTHALPQVAVGAVVFRDGAVLLVKRAHMPGKGLWAIPGGRVEAGEGLADAVRREVLEETGIVIDPGEPIYAFDYIEREQDGSLRFHYVIVDLWAAYVSGEPTGGDDALEARFMTPAQVASEHLSRSTLDLLKRLGFAA